MPGPAWLILPTYDEAENIEAVVAAALPALAAGAPDGHRLLVVDDSSPDGTGRIADRLAAADEAVEVLHRPAREGLGPAYLAGFRHALAHGAGIGARDGRRLLPRSGRSHRACSGPSTPEPTSRSARATSPGGAVVDWGRRGGCSAAEVASTPAPCSACRSGDLTGGFKCFRREVLEAIDLDTVRSHGYAFQVELTYRAILRGFAVTEVPIVFRDRRLGRSKMSPLIAIEACWMLPRLRLAARRGD